MSIAHVRGRRERKSLWSRPISSMEIARIWPSTSKVIIGRSRSQSDTRPRKKWRSKRVQVYNTDASTDNLDRTLAALANPHRRRVVDLLRDRPRRAGELAEATRISFPAMSRHLKLLRKSGLVEEDRDEFDSRVRIYRLRNE